MNTQKGFVSILIILLGLVVIGGGVYFYTTNSNKKQVSINTTQATTTEDILNKKEPSNKIESKIVLENIITPAYIVSIENNKITLDYFETLGGEDAKKAVVEDGKCTQKQIDENTGCFNNGVIYDRNQNPKLRTFELASGVTIITATAFSTDPDGIKNISVEELKRDYLVKENGISISPPYTVTIKNGVVTKIVEMFRP